jgi:hypothetical protein
MVVVLAAALAAFWWIVPIYAAEPVIPVTSEVLAEAIAAAKAASPWYENEPFKTLVAVVGSTTGRAPC